MVGRKSPWSLYNLGLATYDKGDKFNPKPPRALSSSGACRSRRRPRCSYWGTKKGRSASWGPPKMNNRQRHIQGRFSKPADRLVMRYTASLPFDRRLYKQDIAGSIAHAKMLAKQGIIYRSKKPQPSSAGWRPSARRSSGASLSSSEELEDIHMAIEARLIEKIGEAGRKLHTARSRNDQVATGHAPLR